MTKEQYLGARMYLLFRSMQNSAPLNPMEAYLYEQCFEYQDKEIAAKKKASK